MEIKTKHNIGDKVFVIDTKEAKIKAFEIGRISAYVSPVFDNNQTVNYSSNDSYESYPEENCFKTQDELIAYMTRE